MKLLQTLFILFLGLKLASFINWNWFLVFLPLIFAVAIFIFRVVIKEAAKLKQPWAIKLIKFAKT